MTKVVFFGNERLSSSTVESETPLLKGLIDQGYDVAAVVVTNRPAKSRKSRRLEVADVAAEHDIPVIYYETMKSLIEQLEPLAAEVAILAAFGKIIPQKLIDLFPKGILNIHPSDLPEHRGPTPLEQTILSGQTDTAVSVMQLDAGMDTGPVYARSPVKLTGHETKAALTLQLAEIGAASLLALLPSILKGGIIPLEQDHDQATYSPMLSSKTGRIDWAKTATELAREIRAYADWPGSKATIGEQEVTIIEASVVQKDGEAGTLDTDTKDLIMYCQENALCITQLKPAGKKTMDGSSFRNGYL